MLLLLFVPITRAPRGPSRDQGFPALSPVLPAARSRITGCSSQVKRKEHKESELFVIQKWDGA